MNTDKAAVPPSDQRELWEMYARTLLRIPIAGRTLTVTPQDGAPAPATWPLRDAAEAWIITAHNPMSRELGEAENAARHAELGATLAADGHSTIECVGTDPEGTWAETSHIVTGITDERAIALGRQFEQRAVFRWTPEALEVVGAVDEGHVVRGWAITELGDHEQS